MLISKTLHYFSHEGYYVKSRDNHIVINKAVYLAIAVNVEGRKELLGIWIGKNEGAKFWMQVVTPIKESRS